MATTGHYEELTEGYAVIERSDGITATRVFHDGDSSATTPLPNIDDRLNIDPTHKYYECKVVEIQIAKWGGHPSKQLYTVQYSTSPGISDGSNASDGLFANPDLIPITGSLSAEAISIDGANASSTWVWADNSAKMSQQVSKRIMAGSFKVTKRLATLYLIGWSQYAGKINSSTFSVAGNKFAAETVLFNGVDYEQYRNNTGQKRWRVAFSFSVKMLPYGGAYYGWNYIYDDKTNKFRKPVNPSTTPSSYLYNTADLNLLLHVPEVV